MGDSWAAGTGAGGVTHTCRHPCGWRAGRVGSKRKKARAAMCLSAPNRVPGLARIAAALRRARRAVRRRFLSALWAWMSTRPKTGRAPWLMPRGWWDGMGCEEDGL
eukprot:scaffold17348_cov84-Isochrysis_galbana.AAC.1